MPPGLVEALQKNNLIEEGQDPIPPVFYEMQGRIIEFDLNPGRLVARFPVLSWYQNPYGSMQGGMIAAAIDNALGPLSQLLAPKNFTRTLEIKYKKLVLPEHEYITVEAKLVERDGDFLVLSAQVRNSQGELAAVARARHYILKP
jgi:acyl-coenzyme A thioesterase PaaI-like protein